MNEQEIKNLPEYAQKLPKPVRDLVIDGSWQDRVEEVAQKYSLNEVQTETLVNNVLFVITGIDPLEKFIDSLDVELGTSDMLTDQIIGDLETRVFDYVLKYLEKAGFKIENPPVVESPSNIPEIRPETVPSTFVTTPSIKINTEPVQRPVAVPRFTAVPIKDEPEQPAIPHQIKQPPPTSVSVAPTQPKKENHYILDPYREPLS